jgi:molybdopterin-guanine dinucleotide biosynthesis protein B/molybdopterin-guanine dinucleotide biosynthesis protein
VAYGFVLVGGRSARMGRDKTLLPYLGRPMALHQAAKLARVCRRVALVGKHPELFAGSPYAFVEDGAAPAAAIFGVAAALAASPDDTNLVLAADIPRIGEAFLAALLEVAEAIPADAVVPVSGGVAQPLCAVWRRSAHAVLVARLAAGDYALVGALQQIRTVLIPEAATAALPGGHPDNFLNVNTPEDYEHAEKDAGAAAHPPRS